MTALLCGCEDGDDGALCEAHRPRTNVVPAVLGAYRYGVLHPEAIAGAQYWIAAARRRGGR